MEWSASDAAGLAYLSSRTSLTDNRYKRHKRYKRAETFENPANREGWKHENPCFSSVFFISSLSPQVIFGSIFTVFRLAWDRFINQFADDISNPSLRRRVWVKRIAAFLNPTRILSWNPLFTYTHLY